MTRQQRFRREQLCRELEFLQKLAVNYSATVDPQSSLEDHPALQEILDEMKEKTAQLEELNALEENTGSILSRETWREFFSGGFGVLYAGMGVLLLLCLLMAAALA